MRASIVVPVLNSASDLARLLEALVPQADGHEFIVVNDGSDDPAVAEMLARQSGIIAVHHDRTRGSAAARNSGVKRATGDRILFIDADCVPAPGWVDSHVRFHAQWRDEVCVGDIQPWSTHSVLLRFLEYGSLAMFGFHDLEPGHGDPLTHRFFYTANASVPREAFDRGGLFDERYNRAWDDIELAWRLAGSGVQFRFDRDSVVLHRHPESVLRFYKRQLRVGRGYWRYHLQHPSALGRLTLHNQYLSLVSGLSTAWRRATGVPDKLGFLALDVSGRCCFWAGYLAEKRHG